MTRPTPESIEASKAMQRLLQQHAGYAGDIDGAWGPLSRAAMARFQRAHSPEKVRQMIHTATHPVAPHVARGQGTQIVTGEVLSSELPSTTRREVVADNVFRGRTINPSS